MKDTSANTDGDGKRPSTGGAPLNAQLAHGPATATFIEYLQNGLAGSVIATVTIFLPFFPVIAGITVSLLFL